MSTVKHSGNGALILIVDDNPVNLDVLSRRLERDGYRVEARDNALSLEAAVEILKPDAVLLDWMMPQRNGYDALVGLRELFDSNHLPVIMVTARDESDAVSSAINAGANDFVTKPIDFKVLNSRLSGVLARRAHVLNQDSHAAELERLVALRTASLQEANAMLAEEMHERSIAEARSQRLARTDTLTGLPNRFHFLETLKSWCNGESHSSFYLIHVDIDRFRTINSVHGPDAGDMVLKEVGKRLSELISADEMVARTAADEFSILTPSVANAEEAMLLAEAVLQTLEAPIRIFDRKIGLSVSIGVAPSGALPCNDKALLLSCDAAVCAGQAEGGDRIAMFDEDLAAKISENVIIKAELEAGIPRGEIVPYFQPTVSFITGQVEGAEVLARWMHPTRGLVSPAVFIPAAEETGLVDDLFWAMLPVACEQALRSSQTATLAVNLSPSQVLDQSFPQKVLGVLTSVGFPPRRLEIEMTETALFADINATKTALASLRNQGVGVALDDFGVGFSSLSLLRELPISKVKIDRSFVAEILHDESAAKLVKSIITLCKTIDLKVTAEGIEEEAVAVLLAEWGCDYGQGYWLGRPVPEFVLVSPWNAQLTRKVA